MLNRNLSEWKSVVRNRDENDTLRLDIGFFSHLPSALLPNNQGIAKVQFLENEYANTECSLDDRYDSYARPLFKKKILKIILPFLWP